MTKVSQESSADGVHFRTCPLCEATCGLAIEVQDGRVHRIRGDADDVFSRGYVCPKGATLKDLHEDPDRLRAPQIGRGENPRTVTFDEAYREVDERLNAIIEKYGRNAVGVYLGNPNVHNLGGALYMRPLLKALGTRNIFSASTVDQMPRHVSSGLLYGSPASMPVPDIDRCDYLLMLGANPLESNGSLCTAPDFPGRLKALRARGGRLVVVDPRRTRTAELADAHVSIRPGTDVYLLLAMANVLFEEGLAAPGSVEAHVQGLEEVRTRIAEWTPERASALCGVASETIRTLAREIAGAESGAVYGRIGTNTVRYGTLTSWAGDLVTTLAGHLDRPGGLMWPRAAHARAGAGSGSGRGFKTGRWQSRVRGLPEVMGEFPVATLADEIETPGEGQIRALITVGGNPLLSTPNGGRLKKAVEGLEFMVSVDPYRNETTQHADVLLPPPSPLERSHYDMAFISLSVRNVANYSPAIFEAEGPQESEILAHLALIAQGQGPGADPSQLDQLLISGVAQSATSQSESPVHGSDAEGLAESRADLPGPDRIVDLMLRAGPYGDRASIEALEANPHGMDFGPLEPGLPGLLRTESGAVEFWGDSIAADFERLETDLLEPLEDGLLLIGRRHLRSNNSWMHNVEKLVSGKDRCTLQIHPDDAKELGLSTGDAARIRSRVGELVVPVEVTDELRIGVVSLPHGWGHDVPGSQLRVARAHAGVNSNVLTDEEAIDVLSGNAVLNGIPVRVEATSQ